MQTRCINPKVCLGFLLWILFQIHDEFYRGKNLLCEHCLMIYLLLQKLLLLRINSINLKGFISVANTTIFANPSYLMTPSWSVIFYPRRGIRKTSISWHVIVCATIFSCGFLWKTKLEAYGNSEWASRFQIHNMTVCIRPYIEQTTISAET